MFRYLLIVVFQRCTKKGGIAQKGKKMYKRARIQARNGHQMLSITSKKCLDSYLQLYLRNKLKNVPKRSKNGEILGQKWPSDASHHFSELFRYLPIIVSQRYTEKCAKKRQKNVCKQAKNGVIKVIITQIQLQTVVCCVYLQWRRGLILLIYLICVVQRGRWGEEGKTGTREHHCG